jgi:hypothetical protein
MARNDARTQRGLAVQRIVVRSQRDQLVAEQKRRQQVEKDYRKAQQAHAAHERELLEFASRVTPEALQIIDRLNAEGGWPRVAEALQGAGLSPQAVQIATSTVQATGGLGGLQKIVVERLRHERQESAATEIANYARIATPADGARIAELYRQGGPEAVAQALMSEAGLSRDAAEVAFRTMQAGGVEALARGVEARIQHETARQAREAQEEARLAREPAPPEEAAPEAKPVDPLAAEVLKRAAERDAVERKNHPTEKPEADPGDARREALSRKYDELAAKRTRRGVDLETKETVEVPKDAEKFHADSASKLAMIGAYLKHSGESAEVEVSDQALAETSKNEIQHADDDESERNSRTGVLSSAYDILAAARGDEP